MDDLREAIEELGPHADLFEEIVFMGAGYNIGGMANATIGFSDKDSISIFEGDEKATKTKKGQRYLCLLFKLNDDETTDSSYKKKSESKGQYGDLARQLKVSNFFRTPEVWKAIGTDKQYIEWIIQQPSAIKIDGKSTGWDYDSNPGINQDKTRCCDPAHYRDSSETGLGIKPEYSVIPLRHEEHLKQTNEGYSSIGGKEWFQRQRMKYIQEWCWITLKEQLGRESWSKISPQLLNSWMINNNISNNILPQAYKNYV